MGNNNQGTNTRDTASVDIGSQTTIVDQPINPNSSAHDGNWYNEGTDSGHLVITAGTNREVAGGSVDALGLGVLTTIAIQNTAKINTTIAVDAFVTPKPALGFGALAVAFGTALMIDSRNMSQRIYEDMLSQGHQPVDDKALPNMRGVSESATPSGPGGGSEDEDPFATGNTPKASELIRYAERQGWTRQQSSSGPIKYVDSNNIIRMTIKRGSSRAPGSSSPHVELRNAAGKRVNPSGNPVTRKDPGNHTKINYDL